MTSKLLKALPANLHKITELFRPVLQQTEKSNCCPNVLLFTSN